MEVPVPEKPKPRWRVVRSLPEGGQGHIDIVVDESGHLEGEYVRKRLKNPKRIERFKREVEVTRRLDHPNIVRVVDADLESSKPFIITELCSGGTLSYDEAADPLQILNTFLKVCEAVKYAHDKGVIHRDIKPENIFMAADDGEPKVGDFGICYVEDGERFTILDEVVGPRFFSCPEVRDGKVDRVSEACDIYSLGKLLHFMFTGLRFDRENFDDELNDLTRREGGYFLEHVNNMLRRMITEKEGDRFPRMANVIAAVKEVIHLIGGGYNPLTREQGCRYCGKGIYQAIPREEFQRYGLRSQSQALHAIHCSTCGNVQVFFLNDQVAERTWMPDIGLVSR